MTIGFFLLIYTLPSCGIHLDELVGVAQGHLLQSGEFEHGPFRSQSNFLTITLHKLFWNKLSNKQFAPLPKKNIM